MLPIALTTNIKMGAAACRRGSAATEAIVLKALPDALEHCLYVDERWPARAHPTEQARA